LAIWLPFVTFIAEPALTRVWTVAGVLPAAIVLSLVLSQKHQSLQRGPS